MVTSSFDATDNVLLQVLERMFLRECSFGCYNCTYGKSYLGTLSSGIIHA